MYIFSVTFLQMVETAVSSLELKALGCKFQQWCHIFLCKIHWTLPLHKSHTFIKVGRQKYSLHSRRVTLFKLFN